MTPKKGNYEFDRPQSDRDFRGIVYPVIHRDWDWFQGVDLVPEETSQGLNLLDTSANIDYLCIGPRTGIFSIAGRVQRVCNWRTFTIRYSRANGVETEYAKTVKARQSGAMRAVYQVHGYINEHETLDAVYGVRVDPLYDFIDEWPSKVKFRTNRADGNEFIYVDVDTLRRHHVEVKEATIDVQEFMEQCHEKHARNGTPSRPVWTPRPARESINRQAVAAQGDQLRAAGEAVQLCWLPGDE